MTGAWDVSENSFHDKRAFLGGEVDIQEKEMCVLNGVAAWLCQTVQNNATAKEFP